MRLPRFRGQFRFNYVYLIPLVIFFAKLTDIILRANDIEFASPAIKETGSWFISNFIEWFGALYGILVTLVLVRVWEQFDDIDREFDREADTVKILYEDALFLQGKYETIGKDIVTLLKSYVIHVLENCDKEVKPTSDERGNFANRTEHLRQQLIGSVANSLIKMGNQMQKSKNSERTNVEADAQQPVTTKNPELVEQPDEPPNPETNELNTPNERIAGDIVLQEIRRKFKLLLQPRVMNEKVNEILVRELFQRLNELIDIRGDRIGLASQRLFETLRFVVLVTSIIYVLPFYFVSLSEFPSGILDDILIGGVTLLVIFIYLTIEDFDEPFNGTWQISDEPWQRLLMEMASPSREEELKNPDKPRQKKASSTNIQESNKLKQGVGKSKPKPKRKQAKAPNLPTS